MYKVYIGINYESGQEKTLEWSITDPRNLGDVIANFVSEEKNASSFVITVVKEEEKEEEANGV